MYNKLFTSSSVFRNNSFYYQYAIFNVVKSIDNLKVHTSGYFFTVICGRRKFFLTSPSYFSTVAYIVLHCSSLKDQKGLMAVATLFFICFCLFSKYIIITFIQYIYSSSFAEPLSFYSLLICSVGNSVSIDILDNSMSLVTTVL